MPEHLSKVNVSNYYDVPEKPGDMAVSIVPPGSQAAKSGIHLTPILQPAIPQSNVMLVNQKTDPRLLIAQSVHQAWLSVESGLRRQHVPIMKISKAEKVYFILDTYPTNDKITKATPIYELHLHSQAQNKTVLNITDTDGKRINAARAERIMTTVSKGMQGKKRSTILGLF